MLLERAVMFQLQKCEVVGEAAIAYAPGRNAPVQAVKRHEQKALQV